MKHWLDTEIGIIEIDGRFFALNGWNGEVFERCWECGGQEGERFSKMIGHNSYQISSLGGGRYELTQNLLLGEEKDLLKQVYTLLVPYSGAAMTTQGELLRACVWLEHSRTQKLVHPECALKFLRSKFAGDEARLACVSEFEKGDFSNFAKFKSELEREILAQYEKGVLEINEEDFEEF